MLSNFTKMTFLIDNVFNFVKEGIQSKETVIVVATGQHRDDLKRRLIADTEIGFSGLLDRHYVSLDASDTLALFLISGWPDERVFLNAIGKIIEHAAQGRPIRIFGEMVALLWAEGKHRAALRLEELWNQLAMKRSFSLLCAYPNSAFHGSEMASSFQGVCATHSHVIPASEGHPTKA
jgi:hypothetical protein